MKWVTHCVKCTANYLQTLAAFEIAYKLIAYYILNQYVLYTTYYMND